MIKLEFKPLISVGLFHFNTSIDLYREVLQKQYTFIPLDKFGTVTYIEKNDEHMITFRDGLLESVFCYDNLYFHQHNLIGLGINDFIKITDVHYSNKPEKLLFEDDKTPQYVYEFDSVGAQVWVKNDKIISIILNGILID